MNDPRMHPLGAVGVVVSGYLALFGAALGWRLARDAGDGLVCAAPVILAVVLAATSQADRRQYVARLFAAALFLPVGLMMWASSHEQAGLWLLAFALCHVLVFLALVVWLASFATRIDAPPGVTPVGADVLRRRLATLCESAVPQAVARDAGGCQWLVDLHAEGRTHRVLLEIDEHNRAVGVREFLGASGAAPHTEAERSLRAAGEPWFDPSRPEAQATWSRTWQSTMIESERLARAALQFDLDRVVAVPGERSPIDGEALVTLLAAVVTRSGYAWRPQLLPGFGRRGIPLPPQ